MTAPPITPRDLYRFRWANGVRLQPQGDLVAWHDSSADPSGLGYRSALRLRAIDGPGGPWTVTPEQLRAHSAAWSPDGRALAFLASAEAHEQVFALDVRSRDIRRLTGAERGVSSFRWSPDGRHIAFTAPSREDDQATIDRGPADAAGPPLARIRSRLDDKLDGRGFADGCYEHLFVATRDGRRRRQLTSGAWHVGDFDWSADGRRIVFAADMGPDPDLRPLANHLYAVDLAGAVERVATGVLFLGLACSPDGAWLAYVSPATTDAARHWRLWAMPAAGGERRCLSPDDFSVGCSVVSGMGEPLTYRDGPFGQRLRWSADGDRVFFIASEQGCAGVQSATLDGEVTREVGGRRAIYDFDIRGDVIAFLANDPADPSSLHVCTRAGERAIERFNGWLESRALARPRPRPFTADDGRTIDAWLMTLEKRASSQPLILQVHGGPHVQYGWAFSHQFQVLAGMGVGVLYANPRGSDGYGEAFRSLIVDDVCGGDHRDLMDAVDRAVATGVADPQRLGITGESWGGLLTNWAIARTNRFAAAVSEASICNLASHCMETDHVVPNGGDLDRLWERSPLRLAGQIATPLLLLHGEHDMRCSVSQAEQLFAALRSRGRSVRLVRFPGESHSLALAGRPDRRAARLELVAEWFRTHLLAADRSRDALDVGA